jgi:hypothetical protein
VLLDLFAAVLRSLAAISVIFIVPASRISQTVDFGYSIHLRDGIYCQDALPERNRNTWFKESDMSNGAAFEDDHITVELLYFESFSGVAQLVVREKHNNVGFYSIWVYLE